MATRWAIDDPLLADARLLHLILVRHGQSGWNAQGRIQGHAGGDLSELGRREAELTASFLAAHYPRPSIVLTSDLDRAQQTAAPYAEAIGLPVRAEARLREIDNGNWSGRTTEQVTREHSADLQRIRAGEDLPRGGGERVADLAARSWDLLSDLAIQTVSRVAVGEQLDVVAFAHGGSIRLCVASALGLGSGGHRMLRGTSNCSISEISCWIAPDGRLHSANLIAYNSDHHLPGHAGTPGAD